MTTVGFDGKVHRKPPKDKAWLAASLIVNCAYWFLVLFFLLDGKVLGACNYPWVCAMGILVTSFVIPLVISLFFRVPDRAAWTWRFVWYRAAAVNVVALFVSLILFSVLRSSA